MEQNDRMDGAFEPRLEDYRLLTGAGNFQDDEATAGAAWGVFVRSPHAFADIRGIDTASAQAVPGVLAVLPSRPGEFHPEPLTDPDLTLSRHPARATERRLPPPVENWSSSCCQLAHSQRR